MSTGRGHSPLAEVRLIAEKEARRCMPGIIARLHERYGRSQPLPQQQEPLNELVWAALLDSSTQKDADRALKRLVRTFVDWNEVRVSRPEQVETAIKFLDGAAERARRMVSVLNSLFAKRGSLSLAFLHEEKRTDALDFLSSLQGASGEMVARVMFFALGHPAVPLTNYVLRVSSRIGLIPPDGEPDQARNRLEKIVQKDMMHDFHALFNEHGRKFCLVNSPRCRRCAIRQQCATGRALFPTGGRRRTRRRETKHDPHPRPAHR